MIAGKLQAVCSQSRIGHSEWWLRETGRAVAYVLCTMISRLSREFWTQVSGTGKEVLNAKQ